MILHDFVADVVLDGVFVLFHQLVQLLPQFEIHVLRNVHILGHQAVAYILEAVLNLDEHLLHFAKPAELDLLQCNFLIDLNLLLLELVHLLLEFFCPLTELL